MGMEEWDWRRVPKISLLARERVGASTALLSVGLVIVFLVELFFVQDMFRDMSSTQDTIDTQARVVTIVEKQLSSMENEVASLYDQVNELELRREKAAPASTETPVEQVLWASPLMALLAVEGPDVRLESMVTSPDGEIQVIGTVSGFAALLALQVQFQGLSDDLDLQRFYSPEPEEELRNFTAIFQVKPGGY